MTGPKRVQMSRQRPWQDGKNPAVIVARPHRYSNPYVIGTPKNGGNLTRQQAVEQFRRALEEGRLQFTVAEVQRELAGRDLACWCPLVDADGTPVPCHADVLLEVANR